MPEVSRELQDRPNLRSFLQKLARRRKRILCSSKQRKAIEAALRKLGGRGLATTGRIHLNDLKEVLREPPKNVPAQTLQDLVEVSVAYDIGGGMLDLDELLLQALHTEPSVVQRMGCLLPLLVLLAWMLIGPAVFCPVEEWAFLDGLFLSVMTLASVGTSGGLSNGGQVVPLSDGSKVFQIFFVLTGAVLVVWFLVAAIWDMSSYGSSLQRTDLLAHAGFGTKGGLPLEELVGDPKPMPISGEDPEQGLDSEPLEPKGIMQIHRESLRNWSKPRARQLELASCCCVAFWETSLLLTFGIVLVLVTSSGASFLDALSWTVLTGLTVGYGQIQPALGDQGGDWARVWQVVYVLCSLCCLLHIIFLVARRGLRRQAELLELQRRQRTLPVDLLQDLDNGGGVNRLEFLCASLLAADRVSAQDLSYALEVFRRLDPHGTGVIKTPQLESLQRPKEPRTLPEILQCPHFKSQLEVVEFPMRKSMDDERAAAVLREIYQDYDAVRRSLDAKDAELLAALKEHSASEQARAQAVAQREALRKEVMLLSQMKTDLVQRAETEKQQRKVDENAISALKNRCTSLEDKLQEAELESEQVRRHLRIKGKEAAEAQQRSQELEGRLKEADYEIQGFGRRLKEQAEYWKQEAEAQVHQARLEAAEQDMERQGEMQAAQLELKALASSMEAMRGQLRDSFHSSATHEPARRVPLQPWDVWEKAMAWHHDPATRHTRARSREVPTTELLDSQVRQQVEFLDAQVRQQAQAWIAKAGSRAATEPLTLDRP
ncbi:unnamed protein product [Effrenium voratum]|uniref:Potassium channel domain-containing protein n=1 Tax=Effrenium voratum TaxID=2562239 RepID=A0AA36MZ16_9DINO|nr:unnamed protein product [Effrenium voratum]